MAFESVRRIHTACILECVFYLFSEINFSAYASRYRGKRMRIDYFLVSEQLKDRIVSCEMHGRGIELDGMKLKYYHLYLRCYMILSKGLKTWAC